MIIRTGVGARSCVGSAGDHERLYSVHRHLPEVLSMLQCWTFARWRAILGSGSSRAEEPHCRYGTSLWHQPATGPFDHDRPVQVLGTTKRKRMLNRPIMGTEQHHPLPTRLHCPAYALISTQKKPERQEAYALSPASNNIHRGVSTHADYRVLRRRYRLSSYLSPYQAPTCPSPSKSFL